MRSDRECLGRTGAVRSLRPGPQKLAYIPALAGNVLELTTVWNYLAAFADTAFGFMFCRFINLTAKLKTRSGFSFVICYSAKITVILLNNKNFLQERLAAISRELCEELSSLSLGRLFPIQPSQEHGMNRTIRIEKVRGCHVADS